ncbi:hypothetical protein Gpo141_00011461 [Globisporangium polare]
MASATSTSRIPLPLRGYERMMTIADNGSIKVAHIMALTGSAAAIDAFIAHAPQAVAQTFNKHPRMRVKQVRGGSDSTLAEVHPATVTSETVAQDKLLEVSEWTPAMGKWETFVETESNVTFNRYTQFPFYLRVWHYPSENTLRLMWFSDHYMSDGISGLVVLNDVLEFASKLSRDASVRAESLPLRPALYDFWLRPRGWWSLKSSELLMKLIGKMAFRSELASYTPALPIREDQADFQVPVKINSSAILFGQGERENMLRAIKRCKEENVTLFGAIAASIMVAYYIAKEAASPKCFVESKDDPLFKVAAELDYNMRQRVQFPAPETQVGCFYVGSEIERLAKQGVNMQTEGFWDLARQVKQGVDEQLESFMFPFQLILVDEHVQVDKLAKFARDVPVPKSVASDVDISNVGKYPHANVHTFKTSGEGSEESLTVSTVHVCSSVPHLGPAVGMYISSVDTLCYTMMHKHEHEDARTLFNAFTTSVEYAGDVTTGDKMIDVVNRVRKQMEKGAQ